MKPKFCPSGLLFGSAIHEALSVYYQIRLEGKEPGASLLVKVFDRHWAEETLPVRFKSGESRDSLRRKAHRMLEFYVNNAGNVDEVIAVEEPFTMVLCEEVPPIIGRIDLIERAKEGKLILTDFKTASSRREPNRRQLVLYREALRQLDYPGHRSASVRYEVLLKGRDPEIVVFEPQITAGDLRRLRSLYTTVWEDIRRGASCPRCGWWCAGCQWRKYCDQV